MIEIDDAALRLIDFVAESISEETEIRALSAALDPEIRLVADAVIEANIMPRIASQPAEVIEALGWSHRLNELRMWDLASLDGKRAVLSAIFDLRRRSGTRYTMRRMFEVIQVIASIVEWFEEGAPEFSYRVSLLCDEFGITLDQLLAVGEVAHRFEPARAYLSQLAVESNRTAPVVIYPALTVGHLTTVGFGAP